jgi:hypothetical protein
MPSANPITQVAQRLLEKHALSAFFESTHQAVQVYGRDEHNGALTFGMQSYENRDSRLRSIAAADDNSFTTVSLDGVDRVAVDHIKHGLIVLHVYNAKKPDLLPSPNSARMAKRYAATDTNSLFPVKRAYHHRAVGVVSSPLVGLEQVVVGELVKTRTDQNVYDLKNYVELDLSGWDGHGDGAMGPDNPPPPEPEVAPKMTLIRKEDEESV